MSTGEARSAGLDEGDRTIEGGAPPGGPGADDIGEARRVLCGMGVPDHERVPLAGGIAVAMTNLMQRHGQFMNLFGAELVTRGVAEATVNEAATAAGLAMLRKAWGGGR